MILKLIFIFQCVLGGDVGVMCHVCVMCGGRRCWCDVCVMCGGGDVSVMCVSCVGEKMLV